MPIHPIEHKQLSDCQQYSIHGVPVYSPYQLYQPQHTYLTYVIDCLNKNCNALVQSPTGSGKTIALLLGCLAWVKHNQHNKAKDIQIVYTSRTHAQLKQVVAQINKVPYKVKISLLSSRDHACINPSLSQLNGADKQLECRLRVAQLKGLSCQYYKNQAQMESMKVVGKVVDLQELGTRGKIQHFCPFYAGRYARKQANIILMPYNYLFDEGMWREQDGISLKNAIIIFDEGHNISNVCQNSKEISISLTTMSRSLQQFSQLRELKLAEAINQSAHQLRSTVRDLQMQACFITILHAHLQTIDIPSNDAGKVMQMSDFIKGIEESTSNGEFGSFGSKIKELIDGCGRIRSDTLYKPFWAIEAWIKLLVALADLYSISVQSNKNTKLDKPASNCYIIQILYKGSDIILNIHCLTPSIAIAQYLTPMKPQSIILTSGTLSPLKTWSCELGLSFSTPLSCPSIINSDQVQSCIVGKGKSGAQLICSWQKRQQKGVVQGIGQALFQIVKYTSHGVIVFFPSYKMMEIVKDSLTATHVMAKIFSLKEVYFERKDPTSFKNTLDSYLRDSMKSKGAVLFALVRGKVSQGLDFSDNKCRAVVMVGVPYPNAKDVKVTAKMSYLDQIAAKLKNQNQTSNINEKSYAKTEGDSSIKQITGSQWYLTETIRSINQSIGRLIRSPKDYGCIYFIDSRYRKPDVFQQISSWARQNIRIYDNWSQFEENVKKYNGVRKGVTADGVIGQIKECDKEMIRMTELIKGIKTVKGSISRSKGPTEFFDKVEIQKPRMSLKDLIAEIKENKEKSSILAEQERQLQQFKEKQQRKHLTPLIKLEECIICNFKRKLIGNTVCMHRICEQCWQKCLNQDLRCPVCRQRVREKFLIRQ